MTLLENKEKIITPLKGLVSWEDRYRHIIDLGKSLPLMEESLKTEETKIKGCLSQVWLSYEINEGKVIYLADSDSSIVKGIMALLVLVYSGYTPSEILNLPPQFLEEVGVREHLSPNRRNGLVNMTKEIFLKAYAAKKTLESK